MSNKIVVPEGMWIAGFNATITIADRGEATTKCLEAALRWLSENPIVPTSQEVIETMEPFVIKDPTDFIIFGARWQHRMFLAPEPEFDATLGGALLGRTFTREQANAIKNIIDTAVHG